MSRKRSARARLKAARLRLSYQAHRRLLGNRKSARRYASDPPSLSDSQREVVAELREHGIAITHFDTLFDDGGATWDALSEEMDRFVASVPTDDRAGHGKDAPHGKTDYLIRRSQQREQELKGNGRAFPVLSPDEPWLQLSTTAPLLDTVNAYRGMWTKVVLADQWYTVPFAGSDHRVGSQRWHRDPEDLHVVKVFVYFSEVDEGAGPFEYVRGSVAGGPYGHLWPWTIKGGYPPQEELTGEIPDSSMVSATGERGTVIFCDTSGFHRGGFAKTSPRILSTTTYVSPASYLARGGENRRFSVDQAQQDQLRQPAAFALE